MELKGLILSGGKGTRLRPITHTSAKQLVPVANKPVLFYGIEAMADAGIEEVGIIIAPETGPEIKQAVGDGSQFGLRVRYIVQDEPLGLAHAVLTAEPFLGTSPFVMYLGDNLLQGGIVELVDRFRERQPDALILLTPVSDPQSYGIAELEPADARPPVARAVLPAGGADLPAGGADSPAGGADLPAGGADPLAGGADLPAGGADLPAGGAQTAGAVGRVRRLVEKPQDPQSDLALVGVYMFTAAIHDAARAIAPSARGELEITDAIQRMVDTGLQVEPHIVRGWWKDTGQLQDMLEANRLVLENLREDVQGELVDSKVEGRVAIAAGAVLERATVRGPAVIGANAHLRDCYIGPYTAIGAHCTVIGAEVEHSILLEGASVRDLDGRMESSLLGRNVTVRRSAEQPRAFKLLVGDNSDISLL